MENPRPISIAALATGLVADLKHLFRQELRLAQHEMQLELRKLVMGILYASLAILLSLVSITFFLVMLVHILHTVAGMPLWTSYGIVGLITVLLSGVFGYGLFNLASTLRLWPFRTVHSIKEDAQWIKEQLLSTRT
jgi:hypothetical protein